MPAAEGEGSGYADRADRIQPVRILNNPAFWGIRPFTAVPAEGYAVDRRADRLNPFRINMMRGQPSPEQLDLSNHLFDGIADSGYKAQDGSDVRNYGNPAGIAEG